MTIPKKLSTIVKTTSALALTVTVASFSIGIQPGIAQLTSPQKSAVDSILSANAKAFQPPSNPRPARGYRTTTGTRQGSCVDSSETAFTTFGPSQTVGLSASTLPKFVWYLPASETPYPVKFRLLAPNDRGIPAPIHEKDLEYSAGFVSYQLPADVRLSPGVEYRWQIVVVCDTNYLSRSLNQELSFEVASPSADLQQSLTLAATDAERALVYGQAGYWYDAIAQVAQSSEPDAIAIRQSLLADLAKIEEQIEVQNELSD